MPLGVCAGRAKKLLGRRVTIVARPLMVSAGRLLLAAWAVLAPCAGMGLLEGHACGRGLWCERRHSSVGHCVR